MTTTTNDSPASKEKLIKFFKAIDLDFECLMKTKEGRASIHDIIYLAQVQGINLGYTFEWYGGGRG